MRRSVHLSHSKKQFNFPDQLIDFPDHFTENLFRVGRHLLQVLQAVHHQILHARAFLVWNAVAGAWRITQLPRRRALFRSNRTNIDNTNKDLLDDSPVGVFFVLFNLLGAWLQLWRSVELHYHEGWKYHTR